MVEQEEEAKALIAKALELVEELGEEEDIEEEGFNEFRTAKRAAEREGSQGSPEGALLAALAALDATMAATKLKEAQLLSRIGEIIWLAKDAAVLFEDMDDDRGRAAALSTLARAHLGRASEPDAPSAAQKAAKDAVAASQSREDDSSRATAAEAFLVLGEAHVAKASATPYEKVLLEEISRAVEASRSAEELFERLGDRRGVAKALHVRAKALLRHSDEDEVLEGERFSDEAREIFHELGARAAEVSVMLTAVAGRAATSGPETALMMAKDAAEDWQQEGGRPRDAALASVLSAGFQLQLGEHEDALSLCADASSLYDRAGARRGVAAALETKAAILFAMKRHGEALNALEDMAAIFSKLGDKKSQGGALLTAANMLLGKLSEEVEVDTQAEYDKKEPRIGISTDEVHKRSADGLEFAHRASKCFEEAGFEEGVQVVEELVQATYNKAIQIYCSTNEPDQIYYTLSKDSPVEDPSKCIKEWKIPMPAFSKTEGLDQGDGFLHVFDPHPPTTQ